MRAGRSHANSAREFPRGTAAADQRVRDSWKSRWLRTVGHSEAMML
jgi:hypothetical protein